MKKVTLIENILGILFFSSFVIACNNNEITYSDEEKNSLPKDVRAINSYIPGNARIHVFYQWNENYPLQDGLKTECDITLSILDVEKNYHLLGNERLYDARIIDSCRKEKPNFFYNWIAYDFTNLELPGAEDVGYKLGLVTSIAINDKNFIAKDIEIDWYSVFYREKFSDGSYSERNSAELGSHVTWIDSTCEFYSNLEIVCFSTKEIEDMYAPQFGITIY